MSNVGSLAQLVRQRTGNVTTKEIDDFLLRVGADINAFGDTITALGWAARSGNDSLAMRLLKCGSSIEQGRNDGQSPLALAAEQGHVNVARALLAFGADIERANCDGWTPLMYAIYNGHADMADLLLRSGADVARTRGHYGESALHIAARRANTCVRLLLAYGADVNALDRRGDTPLRNATQTRAVASGARWLIAAGASVDACVDILGYTPLHCGAFGHHVDVVQLLLDAGIDLHATTKRGETALTIAHECENDAVIELLTAAEQRSPQQRTDARVRLFASLETEKRALARDRLNLIREPVTEICIGLQSLDLSAFVTLTIVEHACRFAHLVTMHQIWGLVVAVKHFERKKNHAPLELSATQSQASGIDAQLP